jgi:hypothetical protein
MPPGLRRMAPALAPALAPWPPCSGTVDAARSRYGVHHSHVCVHAASAAVLAVLCVAGLSDEVEPGSGRGCVRRMVGVLGSALCGGAGEDDVRDAGEVHPAGGGQPLPLLGVVCGVPGRDEHVSVLHRASCRRRPTAGVSDARVRAGLGAGDPSRWATARGDARPGAAWFVRQASADNWG